MEYIITCVALPFVVGYILSLVKNQEDWSKFDPENQEIV